MESLAPTGSPAPAPPTPAPSRVAHATWADLGDLVRFAAPVVFVQVGLMAMGVVDTIVLGRFSADALAAGALGNLYVMTVAMFGMGVLFALDAIVAQAVGRGDATGVARGMQRGLVLATALSVPSTLVLLLAGTVFRGMGEPAAVTPLADGYVRACLPGVLPLLAFVVLRQSLQAMGRMRPLVWAIVGANLLNALLSWALVFGRFGLPSWGVFGAGVATTISRWLLFLFLLFAGWRELGPQLVPMRADALAAGPLWRMLRLGLPVGFQFVLEVGVFSLVGLFMGQLGTLPLAGHQVALTLVSLTYQVPLGVSVAAAVLVGRAVGRRDPDGARRAARLTLLVSGAFMGLSATSLLLFPRAVAGLYASDPAVVATAAALIPIAGLFQVFDGLQVTAGGVLRGLGNTRAPFLANLVGYWVLGFPTSWYLGFRAGLGPRGLWWGFVVGLGTIAIYLLARVRAGLRRLPEPLAIDTPPTPGIAQPDGYAIAEHACG